MCFFIIMECVTKTSASGGLPIASNSILSIKEEIEISETQFLEHIINNVEVKDPDECAKAEKRSEINGLRRQEKDNQIVLNEREANCETIKEQSYERNLCSKDDTSSSRTYDGIRSAQGKKITCSVCAKVLSSKFEFNTHMNIHTNTDYYCKLCPQKFHSWNNFRNHKRNTHPRFKCTFCKMCCDSRVRMNSHMNMHRGERPFKCETCPKTFMSQDTLSKHKNLHADDGEYECTLCNRKCTDNNKRRKHENTHRNDRWTYHCAICDIYFQYADQYRSHSEVKCRGRTAGKPLQFRCTKCHESFTTISILNQHKNQIHPTVSKKNNHTCSVCPKVYKYKRDLEYHMNIHTGSRPYACPICPKSFIWPQSLSKHKLTHDQLCKRNSLESQEVLEKEKSEKETQDQTQIENIEIDEKSQKVDAFEKKFKCDECNKKFICKRNLKFHLRSHAKNSSS